MIPDSHTIVHLLPEIFLVVLACWMYVGGTISQNRQWWSLFAIGAYLVVGYNLYRQDVALWNALTVDEGVFFTGPIVIDLLGHLLRWIAVATGLVMTLILSRLASRALATEVLATLMLLVAGIMVTARANDLVVLFLGLELVSIPTYVLLFLGRKDRASSEATAKYFFLSVLASALLLYGLATLYGLSGTTTIVGADGYAGINQTLGAVLAGEADGMQRILFPVSIVLILAGLGFRLAAVPFHFYAPDVFQGTTNANAGLLSVAPKLVGVVALVRLMVLALPGTIDFAWQLAIILSILTMTIGNVCALWQTNVRRLLAYSSIAHGGYLLIGLSVALAGSNAQLSGSYGVAAMLVYLFVYSSATLGVFAALAYLGSEEREINSLEELAGAAARHPAICGAIAVFLFSLAGLPPLAGFWGKFALFGGAIRAAVSFEPGPVQFWLVVLAIIGVVNAAIAAAYYLRVIATMYFGKSDVAPVPARGGWSAATAVGLCALLTVGLGTVPGPMMRASNQAERAAVPLTLHGASDAAIVKADR